jgi:predicted ATP-grasp superfamily ATP-dependent carboligase
MAQIGEKLGHKSVVIPTGDVAAILLAENASFLKRWFIAPNQEASLPRTLANKRTLYQLCQRIAVACPRFDIPTSIDDVKQFASRTKFPIVIKAAEAWHLRNGRRTTSIATKLDQLIAAFQESEQEHASNIILQEFVDSEHGEDWFYHGYRNDESQCQQGFTGRKLRSYPVFAGPTTLGQSLPNKPLRETAESLLDALSFRGIVDLDYRFDTRDGQYKLLDFNPRIGAQFRLFEDCHGNDLARIQYLDLTSKYETADGPTKSRTFLVELHDIAASCGYWWRGKLTMRQWWYSLRGSKECAWLSRDDLLPFFMMCVVTVLRATNRIFHIKLPRSRAKLRPSPSQTSQAAIAARANAHRQSQFPSTSPLLETGS